MIATRLTGIGMLVMGLYVSLWPAVGALSLIPGTPVVRADYDPLSLITTVLLPLGIGVTLAVIGAKLARLPDP